MCGRKLTLWNYAWGTSKCGPCALEKTPEAKQLKEQEDIQKYLAPAPSLEAVLNSPRSKFFAKAGKLAFAVNLFALGPLALFCIYGPFPFPVAIIGLVLAFSGGRFFATNFVFADDNLLDVLRWRTFEEFNRSGVLCGFATFVIALYSVSTWANGLYLIPGWGRYLLLAIVGLTFIFGVVLALLRTIATDQKHKDYVTEKWRALHGVNETAAH